MSHFPNIGDGNMLDKTITAVREVLGDKYFSIIHSKIFFESAMCQAPATFSSVWRYMNGTKK